MQNTIGDMVIVKDREHRKGTYYEVCFYYATHPGTWGFTFDCTKDGKPLPFNNESAEANYHKCLTGEVNGEKILPGTIRDTDYDYTTKIIAKCVCGCKLELANFTNTCDCGKDYNMDGSLLADRSQWGEETGEHWSDCY